MTTLTFDPDKIDEVRAEARRRGIADFDIAEAHTEAARNAVTFEVPE